MGLGSGSLRLLRYAKQQSSEDTDLNQVARIRTLAMPSLGLALARHQLIVCGALGASDCWASDYKLASGNR